MPRLSRDYRLLAPDFPGFGYSSTPDDFRYDFDGYAEFLQRFVRALRIERCALYLHDYGSQIALRFAMADPRRITALIVQNGDIYEDQLGPKYETLRAYWQRPTPEGRRVLESAVSEEGFRDEFVGEIECHLRERVPDDLWRLSWSLMSDKRREIMVALMEGLRENLSWFPRYQAYLRTEQPPTLIVWGPQDGYMPEGAARAYLRDLPNAELHFVQGGHWALETNLEEVMELIRDFLRRTLARSTG
jgi:pimeloyl-ACP methyl ester carboxylesterase